MLIAGFKHLAVYLGIPALKQSWAAFKHSAVYLGVSALTKQSQAAIKLLVAYIGVP